jgi:hypothetical protein
VIGWLQRLLDPAYLYALNLGPLGRWGAVYLAWALLLLAGLSAALVWRQRSRLVASTVTVAACGAGLIAVALRLAAPSLVGLKTMRSLSLPARYLLLEAWTARVWPLSATLVALLVPLAHVLSRRPLPHILQTHVDVLVGPPESDRQPALTAGRTLNVQLLLACLHLVGLAWLWYTADRPPWWAVPSLAALTALPLLARSGRLRPTSCGRLETLGPMFVAYGSSAAYWLLARGLHLDVDEYQAFALPDPWSPWFDVPVVVTASVTLTLFIQVQLFMSKETRFFGKNRVSTDSPTSLMKRNALSLGLALLVAAWLAATTITHRTHGVTASDPYCYVQMAIDLAERGAALHEFPLAGLARDLGLPTWPAVHIGYHPPGPDDRAPTMWSIGWPLLMAPLYALGGLNALYWAAPLMGALALVATWCLVDETLSGQPRAERWTVAALCCALVATSPEGSERLLVPMADAAAQLFTVLTVWLLLRGQRLRRAPHGTAYGAAGAALYGALAGACFGAAYFVRHPQLPLGIAAVVAGILSFFPGRERESRTCGEQKGSSTPCSRRVLDSPSADRESMTRGEQVWVRGGVLLLSFALAALLVALPDLAYHRAVYGGWLNSESSEWFLLSARNVGSTFWGILQQGLLRREEIGFLAPFALYGGWLLWHRQRRAAWVLLSGTLAVFLFHLFYAALRPRDLIALLPLLYLCAAYGFVALWRRAQGQRTLLAALLLVCCTTLLFARSYRTLALPWREDVITFGHVRADQAREFSRLRELMPEQAVIGSMLNSGAIELHAGRAAVHPAPWTEEELYRWVEGLLSRGRPFYVLDDGEEMPALIERLEARYRVQPVATLGLPYFAIGGGNLPRSARLYQVEKP